jgi:hypothetical protein
MDVRSLALGLMLLASLAVADTDPRVGRMTYEGSGSAERAPEFGEVWFTFSVGCRKSADDVRKTIEAVSGNIWKAIAAQVPASATNETRQAFWGDIGSISESPGSSLRTTPPTQRDGKVIPGSAKRIETCTGKEIALNAKVGSVFSGSQRFGVRTQDLDWVEGLVRSVQAIVQSQDKDAVRISASGIQYEVTEGTKRVMLSETLNKATQEATGPGSKFASDRRTLRFASAHYLGHRVSRPPFYSPLVGNSVSRGQAPKVTLELPLVYTVYAEAKDLIDTGNSRTQGVRSEYEIVGKAVVDADFGEAYASVSVRCQTTKQAALAATEPYATDLLKDLRDFQGTRPATETDRVENNEAGTPQAYFPYQPVEWETTGNFAVKRYLNTCTGDLVDAPASRQTSDLPSYWMTDRSFGVKSTDFDRLLTLVESLQNRYNTTTDRAEETRVLVGDVAGDVTDATKRKLAVSARENATAYVLNAKGPLAQDARPTASRARTWSTFASALPVIRSSRRLVLRAPPSRLPPPMKRAVRKSSSWTWSVSRTKSAPSSGWCATMRSTSRSSRKTTFRT